MTRLSLALAAVLAGCATFPDSGAAPAPDTYRALGNEPFWTVTIADGRMRYESPDLAPFSVPAPAPRTTFNGHRWETGRIVLDATHRVCGDGMSDRRYADTVTAIVDGLTLEGCGGAILPPASLADTAWSIVEIDGAPVQGRNYFVQFDADRISGQAGCNRFSGSYTAADGTLELGPVAATRMACPGPRMEHERRALRVLSGTVRTAFPDGDTLLLTGHGGTIRLRRSI